MCVLITEKLPTSKWSRRACGARVRARLICGVRQHRHSSRSSIQFWFTSVLRWSAKPAGARDLHASVALSKGGGGSR
jgi:hypothetical protein